jgi:hypothetical protein
VAPMNFLVVTRADFLAMMGRYFAREASLRHSAELIPLNCTYTSHVSQNEIIGVWFQIVQTQITEPVKQAPMYCVMADQK